MGVFVILYLDDILIYIENPGQPHIKAVRWVLVQLQKYSFFANLKKCCFYQDKICFLGYEVSSKSISMEAKRIEVVKELPDSKSILNIQVFLGFANFYWQFIQGFNKIAAPLTSMLKTTVLSKVLAANEVDGGEGGDESIEKCGKLSKTRKLSKFQKLSKSQNLAKSGKKLSKSRNWTNFNAMEDRPKFLTPNARTTFNRLWLAFTEAPILWHLNPECHIWIKINASGYAIGDVPSQLASETRPDRVVTKTDLGQWHLVAFFSRKIIFAETWYETHDGELQAIVKAFKTWHHYLKGCKHEILILIYYNNLCCFIDIKSFNSRQICWAKELSQYNFRIDYYQGKANAAADVLLRFLQKKQEEKDKLRAENGWILHRLQNSLTNVSLAGLSLPSSLLSHLHQVFICGTYVLP